MHGFAHGAACASQGQVFALLEVSWAAAADNDGTGSRFADGDLAAGFEGCDYFELDDEVLLKFFSAAVVCGCYSELKPLPGDGEGCVIRVRVLFGYDI